MIKQLIGGAVVLVIGGSTYAVSQQDVADNLSKNTGMSQEAAQQYVNNISSNDLQSFTKIGQDLVDDGNSINGLLAGIDCVNYEYEWVSPSLSCADGKNQMQILGRNESALGNCYIALDSDLGSSASIKMNECISDIDLVNNDYDMSIVPAFLEAKDITDAKNSNSYNKSILQAALKK